MPKVRRNYFFISANITDSPVSRVQDGLIEKVTNTCLQVVKMVAVSWAACLVAAEFGLTRVPHWQQDGFLAGCWVLALVRVSLTIVHRGVDVVLRMLPAAQGASVGQALLVLCFGHLKAGLVSGELSC